MLNTLQWLGQPPIQKNYSTKNETSTTQTQHYLYNISLEGMKRAEGSQHSAKSTNMKVKDMFPPHVWRTTHNSVWLKLWGKMKQKWNQGPKHNRLYLSEELRCHCVRTQEAADIEKWKKYFRKIILAFKGRYGKHQLVSVWSDPGQRPATETTEISWEKKKYHA